MNFVESKDPTLPINMDYSPELDPEIHGFLREQQSRNKHRGQTQEGRGSAATHCELRVILDGLEKLGFQLVTTAAYTYEGRPHNEFIMHRELISSPTVIVQEKQKRHQEHHHHQNNNKVESNKPHKHHHHHHQDRRHHHSSSSNNSDDRPVQVSPSKNRNNQQRSQGPQTFFY